MAEIIILKHVRLTKVFQSIEQAALSLDGELRALQTVGRNGMMREYVAECAMLGAYIRTLLVLLQSLDMAEIEAAGLSDRFATADAAARRCDVALRDLEQPAPRWTATSIA